MNDMNTTHEVFELVDRLVAAAPGSPDELSEVDNAMRWRVHLQACGEMVRRIARTLEQADAQTAEARRLLTRSEAMLAAIESATPDSERH